VAYLLFMAWATWRDKSLLRVETASSRRSGRPTTAPVVTGLRPAAPAGAS
jgi:threonine/homoserine/homoserine lactone efflux protein